MLLKKTQTKPNKNNEISEKHWRTLLGDLGESFFQQNKTFINNRDPRLEKTSLTRIFVVYFNYLHIDPRKCFRSNDILQLKNKKPYINLFRGKNNLNRIIKKNKPLQTYL